MSVPQRPVLVSGAQVLVQEILIGAALYLCAVAIRAAGLGAGPLALALTLLWVLVLLWTRRFGVLRPRCWGTAFTEASLLCVGSICCVNALLSALNSVAWP